MANFKTLSECVEEALDEYNAYASSLQEAFAERRKVLNGDLYLQAKRERYETFKAKLEENTNV
jgi:hypothetical protein